MWPACQQPLPTRSFIHHSKKFLVRYQSAKESVKRRLDEAYRGKRSNKSQKLRNEKCKGRSIADGNRFPSLKKRGQGRFSEAFVAPLLSTNPPRSPFSKGEVM